jgi:biopolymer transport protein ExbD
MQLPQSVSGSQIADMGNTLTLNVHFQNLTHPQVTTLVGGQLADLPLLTPTGGNQLLDLLKALHARNPHLKVIVRAPKDMPYSYLEPVLQTCAQAGVPNVNFNTEIPVQEVR